MVGAPSGAIEWTLTSGHASSLDTSGLPDTSGATLDTSGLAGYEAAALDCSDFDDCSAMASADAFAIF